VFPHSVPLLFHENACNCIVHAWSGAHLSQKHKAFVSITNDVAKGLHAEGSPVQIHYGIARRYGANQNELAAVLTFLAPHLGFPMVFASFPGLGKVAADNKDKDGLEYQSSLGSIADPNLPEESRSAFEREMSTIMTRHNLPEHQTSESKAFDTVWALPEISAISKAVICCAALMTQDPHGVVDDNSAPKTLLFKAFRACLRLNVFTPEALESFFQVTELYLGRLATNRARSLACLAQSSASMFTPA
jgi:alkylhydroperoxidase/carboxymuconolactone decarboxylase family protein YurZ